MILINLWLPDSLLFHERTKVFIRGKTEEEQRTGVIEFANQALSNGSLIAFENWCNDAEIGKLIFKECGLGNDKHSYSLWEFLDTYF